MRPVETLVRAEVLTFAELSGSEKGLVTEAIRVRLSAYAPYSNYLVGAAVLSEHGSVYVGCNVENAIYAVMHAEHNGIGQMIATEGSRARVRAVAVFGAPRGEDAGRALQGPVPGDVGPIWLSECGAPVCAQCAQFIWEHCDENESVELLDIRRDGYVVRTTIRDVLPMRFGPANLGIRA